MVITLQWCNSYEIQWKHIHLFPGYLYHFCISCPTLMYCELLHNTLYRCFTFQQNITSEIHKKDSLLLFMPFLRQSFILAFFKNIFPLPQGLSYSVEVDRSSNFREKLKNRLRCISKTHPTGKWITTARKDSVNSMHKINIFPLGYEQ